MTKYREILRLYSQGISKRGIASSCQCSRDTITAVLERAEECGVSWPMQKDMTDGDLQILMFPEKSYSSNRKLPDSEHYETAVIPARVRRPKDKPSAEGTVGIISTWITAALRNQEFFSLRELNEAMSFEYDWAQQNDEDSSKLLWVKHKTG